MEKLSISDNDVTKPSPADFDVFLPWACSQLQKDFAVCVNRVKQQEYVSVTASKSDRTKSTTKTKLKSRLNLSSELDKEFGAVTVASFVDVVNVLAVYDHSDNLVQIKFNKNKTNPRLIFKVIALIVKYHSHLASIIINKGADMYTIYEICKFLSYTNITEICLDDTCLKHANLQILLETPNSLKNLSLARCGIDDGLIEMIAASLVHSLPASKTLSILNLATNRISDTGAMSLSNALRSNRQLSYINLSDNMLTDRGAEYLLDTLTDFPLVFSELLASRTRYIAYLKEKSDLINRIVKELRSSDIDKRSVKRRPTVKTPSTKKNKLEKEASLKTIPESDGSTNLEGLLDKATNMAVGTLGEFTDPFFKKNTYVKDGIVYSFGNNALCYLNLAFNKLTFLTVKKLLDVLTYQRNISRTPRGLVNFSIEGNAVPVYCSELADINAILDQCLASYQRKTSTPKKKSLGKKQSEWFNV